MGLLWTSDHPDAETSPDNTRYSQQTNIHAPGGIRTHNLSMRAAAELRLRTRGHWDRQYRHKYILYVILEVYCEPHFTEYSRHQSQTSQETFRKVLMAKDDFEMPAEA